MSNMKNYKGSYANTCEKCKKGFPNRVIIDGKVKKIGGRKYCLECSPWGRHNTIRLAADKSQRWCSQCRRVLARNLFSIRHTQKGTVLAASYCKECTANYIITRGAALKAEAVAYKGGECQVCQYSRCLRALQFHHRDPQQKEFSISQSSRSKCHSFESIKQELDKCVLVCSRCHTEIEEGLIPLPS
jgi:hypothetical protein